MEDTIDDLSKSYLAMWQFAKNTVVLLHGAGACDVTEFDLSETSLLKSWRPCPCWRTLPKTFAASVPQSRGLCHFKT